MFHKAIRLTWLSSWTVLISELNTMTKQGLKGNSKMERGMEEGSCSIKMDGYTKVIGRSIIDLAVVGNYSQMAILTKVNISMVRFSSNS
jgi:hypothetical protein